MRFPQKLFSTFSWNYSDESTEAQSVSFGADTGDDKDGRIPTSRPYASPSSGALPSSSTLSSAIPGAPATSSASGQSAYASPVASLQTWVNGFAPPSGGSASGTVCDVKTEGVGANAGDVASASPSAGAHMAEYKTDGTSSNVSPLSSTLSNSLTPYSGSISSTQLHPAYASATSSANAYESAAAASYYGTAGYYHPGLTAMDPYSYASTGVSSASTATSQSVNAFQVSQKFWAICD